MEDKAAITRVSKAEETLAIVLGNRHEGLPNLHPLALNLNEIEPRWKPPTS